MMKIAVLAGAAFLLTPLASFAATYHYVDTSGTVRTVSADNAAQAYAQAYNIAPHSGVTLDTGVLDSGDTVTGTNTGTASGSVNEFHYVDANGVVRTVTATTPSQALNVATGIDVHSGVAVDRGVLDSGDTVPGV
jgi:hypothetical protein